VCVVRSVYFMCRAGYRVLRLICFVYLLFALLCIACSVRLCVLKVLCVFGVMCLVCEVRVP